MLSFSRRSSGSQADSTVQIQVKGGGIGPGRGARIYAQVADVFPAGTISKDDLRTVYNEVCMPPFCYSWTSCNQRHLPDCITAEEYKGRAISLHTTSAAALEAA